MRSGSLSRFARLALPAVAVGGAALFFFKRRGEGPSDLLLEEGGEDEAGQRPGGPDAPRPAAPKGQLGKELEAQRQKGWDLIFRRVEAEKGLPTGLLSAVVSRETNSNDILGDEGHGRGAFQIDDRSHGAWLRAHDAGGGKPSIADAALYAADLLLANMKYGREHGVPEGEILKFALSAYNLGPGKSLAGFKQGDSDRNTTGHNYGRDVLRRWREMFPGTGTQAATEPTPAVASLLAQVDQLWPGRNRSSDGVLGDEAHPDHHAGLALDITNDPSTGPDLDQLADVLLADPRTHYVIWNGRIANPEVEGGAWRQYPVREPGEDDDAYRERAKGFNRHSRHMHLSILADHAGDARAWPAGAAGGMKAAERANPAPPVVSDARLPGLLKQGLVELWKQGLVDNFRWIPVKIGPYEIQVTADAASAFGLRLPASFDEMLTVAGMVNDILPNTKITADARWKNAARRIVLPPLPGGEKFNDAGQVAEWDARLGPVSLGELVDGGWKEWILEPDLDPKEAVNYGLRGKGGKPDAVWQSPGHHHNSDYKGYSQLATFVARKALKNGVEVDLLDELAKGGPLGGPLPPWIVDRLNGVGGIS